MTRADETEKDAEKQEDTSDRTWSRRSILGAAGMAAAVIASSTLSGPGTPHPIYTTIKLSAGESRGFHVGDGETLENVIIDISAPGAEGYITASGSDWTIRNVSVRGRNDLHKTEGTRNVWAVIHPEGNGRIENVYLGDGCVDGAQRSAIGLRQSHAGHIVIENCHVAEWADNGIYAANVAEGGGGGTVAVRGCYLRDNNIGQLRLASDGSSAKDCVVHNTGNVPATDGGTVGSYGVYTGYGDEDEVVRVDGCHIDVRSSNTNGTAYAFVADSRWTGGNVAAIHVTDTWYRGDVSGAGVVFLDGNGHGPVTNVPVAVPTRRGPSYW